jgi:zinc/manganese transport system ATP-binding protein
VRQSADTLVGPALHDEALRFSSAAVRLGRRRIWGDVSLCIREGEFAAVLGPNGAGKSTLLKAILGLLPLSEGSATVLGRPPGAANSQIGYLPQRRSFDAAARIRGVDIVRLGLDGARWGVPLPGRAGAETKKRVNEAIELVGAGPYAERPIGRLSGGEQQRLRVAQALVADPVLILADEPLLSLDLAHQRGVVDLLDARRERAGTPVVFVTHDVNPVLHTVDRVLYLAPGSWAIGTPDEVLTSATLSRLYGTDVDVLRVRGRVVVVGTPDDQHVHHVENGH